MRTADMLTKIFPFQVESGDDFNPGIYAARDGAFESDNQLFKETESRDRITKYLDKFTAIKIANIGQNRKLRKFRKS
jgi:hypothetical protein